MELRPCDLTRQPTTLGQIVDEFVSSCPTPIYGDILARPVVRRYLINYVLQRIQWELPPGLLRVDETQPEMARQDVVAFRQYVECAIYWGMEEIIRDRLDLSLSESHNSLAIGSGG